MCSAKAHWRLDAKGPKLGEQLGLELEEKCYPHYNKAYEKAFAEAEEECGENENESRVDFRCGPA